MEMTYDVSDDFSSLYASKSDSSMFFCQPKQEEIEQQQQYNPNSSKQHDQRMIVPNQNRVKKTVSFPFGKCRICHDTATGVHYGVITCEGCKGFFKRSITQGIPYRCFFGDKCIITMETRNRCKACRFKECVEQGMAMESVKMGRIPKKVKEKALKNYQKYQERKCQNQQLEDPYDEDNDSETDDFDLSSIKRESVSSTSSSSTSSINTRQSIDSNQDIIIVPQRILNSSDVRFRTADLIELTISSSNSQVTDLSSLRLPTVFYESYSFSSDIFGDIPVKTTDDKEEKHLPTNDTMTVSKYISNIHQNTLIDYMFGYEIRYSNNVLHIMKSLASKLCQPFLIYELDFEVSSFFRYIRWKMLNSYLKHTKKLRILVERMFGIINLGITNYPGVNATVEYMWSDIQASIPSQVTYLLNFAKDTPGLNELDVNDFTRILNHRVFDFYAIIHYPLYYQNESYLMTINGLHYSRFFMNKFIGKETTDALHEFSERLHNLNITQVEHSLIIPMVLCLPDEQLIDSESVHIVKYCYMYALYIQLCTTRTEDEAKSVFNKILQIVDSIAALNELCKKNIGELILDKSTSHK